MGLILRLGLGAVVGVLAGGAVIYVVSTSTEGAVTRAREGLSNAKVSHLYVPGFGVELAYQEDMRKAISGAEGLVRISESLLAEERKECTMHAASLESARDKLQAAERELEIILAKSRPSNLATKVELMAELESARAKVSFLQTDHDVLRLTAAACTQRVKDLESSAADKRETVRRFERELEQSRQRASETSAKMSAQREEAIAAATSALSAASQRHEERSALGQIAGALVGLLSGLAVILALSHKAGTA